MSDAMTDIIDTPIDPEDGLPTADLAARADQLGIDFDTVIEWFGGEPVVGIELVVTRAGDGLSEPLAAAPKVHHRGDRGTIVLDGSYARIEYKPHPKKAGALIRVEKFVTESGMEIDPKVVARQRKATQTAVEDWRARVGDGQMRLGEDEDIQED